jgi:hypothetical protein
MSNAERQRRDSATTCRDAVASVERSDLTVTRRVAPADLTPHDALDP